MTRRSERPVAFTQGPQPPAIMLILSHTWLACVWMVESTPYQACQQALHNDLAIRRLEAREVEETACHKVPLARAPTLCTPARQRLWPACVASVCGVCGPIRASGNGWSQGRWLRTFTWGSCKALQVTWPALAVGIKKAAHTMTRWSTMLLAVGETRGEVGLRTQAGTPRRVMASGAEQHVEAIGSAPDPALALARFGHT
jgi:hypothetical protein